MAKTQSKSSSANVDSVSFDLTNCVLKQKSDDKRGWLNEEQGVAHLIKFSPEPASWPFQVNDIEAAKEFYSKMCSGAGGVMLDLKNVKAGGRDALCGLFKYKFQPRQRALQYVGIVWIPFENYTFQINVESVEQGTTGRREAAIMLELGDEWPGSYAAPIFVASAEELMQRLNNARVINLPSDDEKYDPRFPDHPLSKVRRRLHEIIHTLKFDESIL